MIYISAARIPSEKAHVYQILQMCDAFAGQGVDVELLHPHRVNTPLMRDVQDIKSYYGLQNDFSIVELPAVDLLRLTKKALSFQPRAFSIAREAVFWLIHRTYNRSVKKYLQGHEADLFYLRNWKVLRALVQSRPDLATHMFFEAHDEFPDTPRERRERKDILQRIGGLITTNSFILKRYIECGIAPDNALIARNGINLQRFTHRTETSQEARARLGLPPNAFIVGYVGRLQTLGQEKGVDHLIEAISIVKQANPLLGVALCCVGGPDDMIREYRDMARVLGLSSGDVIFVPQTPPTAIPDFLQAFDVCAMPFPWTQHYAYYMSPLKLFEYMAAERAIIATRLPAIEEVLEHKRNAYLVPPNDAQSLAEGIDWMNRHTRERRAIAEQARKDVEQYTWSKRAARIGDFASARL